MKLFPLKLGLLLSVVILFLPACGRSTTPTTIKASPTPAEAGFPTGSFVSGEYSMEFRPDGTLTNSGPQGSETGTYTADSGQVFLTSQDCGNVRGTYIWTYDGVQLVFKAVDDSCTNRREVITSAVWLKH